MIRRPPRSTLDRSSAASDVYKRQDIKSIIPDPKVNIKAGGIAPLGAQKDTWIFKQLIALGRKYNFNLTMPIADIPEESMNIILYGSEDVLNVSMDYSGGNSYHHAITYEGIVNFIVNQEQEQASNSMRKWVQSFMLQVECPECHGTRLKKESLYFKINEKNIADLANMDILAMKVWLSLIHI